MDNGLKNTLLTALLALTFGFLGAATWSYTGLADNRTRAFLMENPRVLRDVAEALAMEQARDRLAEVEGELNTPFPGAVIGNPEGSRVLVEFTDYNCGFCEASLADVLRLVEEDPELKVIMRELPLLNAGSEDAARMALAAAGQGRYREFHEEMFRMGPATPETVEAAAMAAGLDMDRARADAASEAVTVELARNLGLAQALGFTGTPAFIAEGTPFGGAVGYDRLKEALENADG